MRAGRVSVHSRCLFERVGILMGYQGGGSGELSIHEGGSIVLRECKLEGILGAPMRFRMKSAGNLTARNSSVVNCGPSLETPEESGPYIRGANVVLERFVTEDCMRGLILVDCEAELYDCRLEGTYAGLLTVDSRIAAKGCALLSPQTGASMRNSTIALEGGRTEGNLFAVFLEGTRININGSHIRARDYTTLAMDSDIVARDTAFSTNDTLFTLIRCRMEMWACNLSSTALPGRVSGDTAVSLYNTTCPTGWDVQGDNSRVETLWSHDIHLFYSWNGEVAHGVPFSVHRRGIRELIGEFTLGPSETSTRLWLCETIVHSTFNENFTPYHFEVNETELRVKREVPGDQASVIVLRIRDHVPPSVTILSPSEGAWLNGMEFVVEGNSTDLGSGIGGINCSIDGLLPIIIDPGLTNWSIGLEAGEGQHVITVTITDRYGNTRAESVRFSIDTNPPIASFSAPENNTVVGVEVIELEGFVIVGEYAPLKYCYIAGVLVSLGHGTEFSAVVDLPSDGEHTFVIEASDMAGNVGCGYVTLVRDMTPPEIDLFGLPSITNQLELAVRGRCTDAHVTRVSIDGYHVIDTANGTFEHTVSLSEGSNSLSLTAEDLVGNLVEISILVHRDTQLNGTIMAPDDMAVIRRVSVELSILTDPGAQVRVLDLQDWTNANEDGFALINITFESLGRKHIVVEFRDTANNTLIETVTVVIRMPPEGEAVDPLPWLAAMVLAVVIIGAITYLGVRRRRGGAVLTIE
jgi:hypothetical protein